jgi:hypothetical protein
MMAGREGLLPLTGCIESESLDPGGRINDPCCSGLRLSKHLSMPVGVPVLGKPSGIARRLQRCQRLHIHPLSVKHRHQLSELMITRRPLERDVQVRQPAPDSFDACDGRKPVKKRLLITL